MDEMKGKVCMITGANSGIGKETALALAAMDAEVIMIARDPEKGVIAKNEIIGSTGNHKVHLLIADLSLMSEVKKLAREVVDKFTKLDVLINNAGGINQNRFVTSEGNELTLAVNYLAPFLLTHELLKLLKCSESARIINVSSSAHSMGKIMLDDFQNEQYRSFRAYGSAKLYTIMFTYELARRLEGTNITVNVLHPGVVNTRFGKTNASRMRIGVMNLFSKFAKSPKKGAKTSIFLASSRELNGVSGAYFTNSKIAKSSKISHDIELQKAIWKKTEELLGIDTWSYIRYFDDMECSPTGV